MPGKMSVTVPLTARQKAQIKKATGKSINALKVESAGRTTLAKKGPIRLARNWGRMDI